MHKKTILPSLTLHMKRNIQEQVARQTWHLYFHNKKLLTSAHICIETKLLVPMKIIYS